MTVTLDAPAMHFHQIRINPINNQRAHQAQCTCGWTSTPQPTNTDARQEGRQHLQRALLEERTADL